MVWTRCLDEKYISGRILHGGRKLPGFEVGIDIDLVFVLVVEINFGVVSRHQN